jgi:biotin carboxyl carrier protein
LTPAAGKRFALRLGGEVHQIEVSQPTALTYQVVVDGQPVELQLAPLGKDVPDRTAPASKMFRILVGGRWLSVVVSADRGALPQVTVNGDALDVEVMPTGARGAAPAQKTQRAAGGQSTSTETQKRITAVMPGRIVAVSVTVGQPVSAGREVCVLEAMKMEQIIRAPMDGVVKQTPIKPGQSVAAGDLLVELE